MSDPLAPYRRLVAMVERELELAAALEVDALAAAVAERAALAATLPPTPPDDAGPLLAQLEALHARAAIETERARELIAATLTALDRGLRATRGYAPPRRTTARAGFAASA